MKSYYQLIIKVTIFEERKIAICIKTLKKWLVELNYNSIGLSQSDNKLSDNKLSDNTVN